MQLLIDLIFKKSLSFDPKINSKNLSTIAYLVKYNNDIRMLLIYLPLSKSLKKSFPSSEGEGSLVMVT